MEKESRVRTRTYEKMIWVKLVFEVPFLPAGGRNFLAGSGRLSVSQHRDARDTLLPRADRIARVTGY